MKKNTFVPAVKVPKALGEYTEFRHDLKRAANWVQVQLLWFQSMVPPDQYLTGRDGETYISVSQSIYA
jgi:hypothetical protein